MLNNLIHNVGIHKLNNCNEFYSFILNTFHHKVWDQSTINRMIMLYNIPDFQHIIYESFKENDNFKKFIAK